MAVEKGKGKRCRYIEMKPKRNREEEDKEWAAKKDTFHYLSMGLEQLSVPR